MKKSKDIRRRLILKDLVISNIPISVETFCKKYDIKNRMLRYDMDQIRSDLEEFGIALHYKVKNGYFIDQEDKHRIPREIFDTKYNFYSEEEFKDALFFELILSKESVTSDFLADKYFSSPSTISRSIQKDTFLLDQEIVVKSRKFKGYYIEGNTDKVVEIAVDKLVEYTYNYFLLEDIYNFLPHRIKEECSFEKFQKIDETLKKQNRESDIWLEQDKYKKLLFLWVIVWLINIKECNCLQDMNVSFEETNYIESISQKTGVKFSKYQKCLLLNSIKKQSITIFQKQTSKKLKQVIRKMIEGIVDEREYDIHKLSNDLLPHLTLTLNKIEQNIQAEKNPLLEQILDKYPLEKNIASKMLEVFKQELDIAYSLSDLSYLVMYLYKNRKNSHYNKMRVAVVCATGRGFSNLMEARLLNRFQNISISKTVSAFHHETFDKEDIDLIISTIPIDVSGIPIVIVSPILGHDDLKKIQKYCDNDEQIFESASFNQSKYIKLKSEEPKNIGEYANQISKITIYLLDNLTEFIDEYEITPDKMLGLVIHMLMAVERWLNDEEEQFENATEDYKELAKKHPRLYKKMESFFVAVEQHFECNINISERLAFFHYIG